MDENLYTALLILTLTLPAVALARGFRFPSILAYLVVGAVVGPAQLGLIHANEQIHQLGEWGVAFLMFSLGLEFNLSRLFSMRRLVFGLGGAQVCLTMAAIMLATMGFGLSWQAGLALGGVLAMSSTAIIAHVLSERLEVHSPHGRQVMGVLLFQDLAVVPLLILIPSLASGEHSLASDLLFSLGKAIVVLGAVFLLGPRLIQPLFNAITKRRSTELFMLNVLWIAMVMAAMTQAVGLSLALGAFLGGMLISETVFRHQVESDIRPFRDILLGVFFITIGMELDLPEIGKHLPQVIMLLILLVASKALIATALSKVMGSNLVTAMRVGIQLSFAGEFGFVLLTQAARLQIIDTQTTQSVLATMLISMLVGPLLAHKSRHVARFLLGQSTWASHKDVDLVAESAGALSNHVIVCGYGRTGKQMEQFLRRENVPCLALELDAMLVSQPADAASHIVFGDAGKKEILLAAGIARASAVVVTYKEYGAAMRAVGMARQLNPNVPILVRTGDDSRLEKFMEAGATEVIPEVLEASLMLATQTLLLVGVPPERIEQARREVRKERYRLLA